MPRPLDENRRLLEAAQGYAAMGLYMRANQELERMSHDSRHWPEALAVKLAIFDGLELWEMVEIVAAQLADRAAGKRRRITMAETVRRETFATLA
jgi:lipopolysaccharide biosynthesis regulator YciM